MRASGLGFISAERRSASEAADGKEGLQIVREKNLEEFEGSYI